MYLHDTPTRIIGRFFEFYNVFLIGCPLLIRVNLRFLVFLYSYFIEWDTHIQTPKCIPTKIQDTIQLYKLGHVQHIFSSKNEILSDNFLVFKMCCIGDKIYGAEEQFTEK